MYTKRLHLSVFITALILALVVAGRTGLQIYGNYQKTNRFSYSSSDNPYKREVPIDLMDLSELDPYLNITMTLLSTRVSNTLELPKNIIYYELQDGEMVPALELPKGTAILWIPTKELNDFSPGYGCRSYPTYEKGWRYTRPFMIFGKGTGYLHLPHYFVRTGDLESVAKAAIKSTKPMMNALKSKGISVQDGAFIYTRFIDNIFYEKGVFCSPDLVHPVWQLLDTVMMSLAAALFIVYLYMKKKTRAPNTENIQTL